MLHMILGILKMIGIVLGILLLVFLAILLAVIFVPVRYRVQAEKREDRLGARIKISWLFHLVSISFQINKRAEHEIRIRLFGIRLPLFRPPKEKRRFRQSQEADPDEPELYQSEPEADPDEPEVHQSEPEADPDEPELHQGSEEANAGPKRGASEKRNVFAGLKIRSISDKIKEIDRKIKNLLGNVEKLAKKSAELLKKPGQLSELARKLEIKEVGGDLFRYLKVLLRHYLPRSLRGYLRFGTGDPAVTAQITGLLYLILPARADSFTVQPEFGEAVLEMDLSLRGHIRAIHLLCVLWRGFRNKKLRRLIRYQRKGAACREEV